MRCLLQLFFWLLILIGLLYLSIINILCEHDSRIFLKAIVLLNALVI